ncbi:MAG TPA: TetR/AcrR family transcriptional regulator [Solirubrobacterales bacterium]|nr:TetR/AcrR family transcriptional regulator [Solirubrobacterales bacterium]
MRPQRERLVEAAVRVVAEKGYGATTIGDLTREASISRTTFYELFDDKEACFLAAFDSVVELLMRRIVRAYEAEEHWPERARAGLEALLETLADEPALARLAMVHVGSVGPAAQRRHRVAMQRLTPLFDEGRDFAPSGHRLPANTSRMAVGGLTGLISDELLAGRTPQLLELLPDLLFAVLVPYVGPRAAVEEIRRAAADGPGPATADRPPAGSP